MCRKWNEIPEKPLNKGLRAYFCQFMHANKKEVMHDMTSRYLSVLCNAGPLQDQSDPADEYDSPYECP